MAGSVSDPYSEPISSRRLTRAEVYGLALPLWPHPEVDNAVNVAYLESGFVTGARNTKGEDSRGLWQMNVAPGANPALRVWNLYDPQLNAWFAYVLWRERGWHPWYNSAVALKLIAP